MLRQYQNDRKCLLTRPPRFGKTIFCEMLGAYVDSKTSDETFERLFGGTKIHQLQEDSDYAEELESFRGKGAHLSLVSHCISDVVLV